MKRNPPQLPAIPTSELPSGEAVINLSRNMPSFIPEYFHFHTQLEIGMCLSGNGVFYINNNVYPFAAGDISFIYPGEHHIAQSSQYGLSEWYFFAVEIPVMFSSYPDYQRLVRLSQGRSGHGHILSATENRRIAFYLKRIFSLYTEDKQLLRDKIPQISALTACILYETEEWEPCEADASIKLDHLKSERLSAIFPAIQYMLSRYYEPIRTEELCACCSLSPVHLRRLFADAVGISPLAFLQKIRISHACTALVGTELSILTISEQCGYPSLSSFNRQFHKYMGISPSAYRTAFIHKQRRQ